MDTQESHQRTSNPTQFFNSRLLIDCSNTRNKFMNKHLGKNFSRPSLRCTRWIVSGWWWLWKKSSTAPYLSRSMNKLKLMLSARNNHLKSNNDSAIHSWFLKGISRLMSICLEFRDLISHPRIFLLLPGTWSICIHLSAIESIWARQPSFRQRSTATGARDDERATVSLSRKCSSNCRW